MIDTEFGDPKKTLPPDVVDALARISDVGANRLSLHDDRFERLEPFYLLAHTITHNADLVAPIASALNLPTSSPKHMYLTAMKNGFDPKNVREMNRLYSRGCIVQAGLIRAVPPDRFVRWAERMGDTACKLIVRHNKNATKYGASTETGPVGQGSSHDGSTPLLGRDQAAMSISDFTAACTDEVRARPVKPPRLTVILDGAEHYRHSWREPDELVRLMVARCRAHGDDPHELDILYACADVIGNTCLIDIKQDAIAEFLRSGITPEEFWTAKERADATRLEARREAPALPIMAADNEEKGA